MLPTKIHLCIICGREFRPATPETVICPPCGGPPEAPATEQPQGTILMDAPQVTISTDDAKARPQETVGVDAAGELRFCIRCGREFYTARIDADKCPSCGGPPEATEHPLGKIDLDKPQVTLTDDRPEAIASTPQATRAVEPESISPPSETSAIPTRTFAAEDDVPDEWQVGNTILNLYEVKHIFTTGGMGLVYRVHHLKWNLDLAVKSPRAHLFQTEEQKQMFIAEAETWIELGLHPHIVTCYYVRTLGGIPRVFAEFVEGGSLKDWIRDRRLYEGGEREALRRILDVAIQFAWGLGYAHEKGMVHQDVKPANALMTPDGTLKVTDFGLVKAKGRSPAYSAPEQDPHVSGQIDRRTDIWCWGVSVLEMFTGEATWQDGSIAADILNGYLVSPPAGLPHMPQGVANLLRGCFQDLNLRPPSMDAVAERLMAVYEQEFGEPYPREKPNPLDLRADSLNNRAVSYLDLGREDKAVQCWQEALEVDPAHLEANFNYGYHRWHRAELLGSEYLTQMQQLESTHRQNPEYWRLLGWIYLEQGYVEEVEEILQKRGVQDDALERAHRDSNRPAARLLNVFETGYYHSDSSRTYVAHFPRGDYAAYASNQENVIKILCVDTGEIVRSVPIEGEISGLITTDDGVFVIVRNLVVSSGVPRMETCIWLLRENDYELTFYDTFDIGVTFCFSNDASLLLESRGIGQVRLWERKEKKDTISLDYGKGISAIALSRDKRWLLISLKGIILWDLSKRREVRHFQAIERDAYSLGFLAGNRYILAGYGHQTGYNRYHFTSMQQDNNLRVWEVETGREICCLEHESMVCSISVSPKGRNVLTGTVGGKLRSWEIHYPDKPVSFFPALTTILTPASLFQNARFIVQTVRQAKENIKFGDFDKAYSLLRQVESQPIFRRHKDLLDAIVECGLQANAKRKGLYQAWCISSRKIDVSRSFGTVESMAFRVGWSTYQNSQVLVEANNRSIRIWDILNSKILQDLKIPNHNFVSSVTLSSDARYIASGEGRKDSRNAVIGDFVIRLWDMAQGKQIECFRGAQGIIGALMFSPNGYHLVSIESENIWKKILRVWDTATGQQIWTLEEISSDVVGISPDSKYLTIVCRNKLCLYTMNGELVWEFGQVIQRMLAISFLSTDSLLVAYVDDENKYSLQTCVLEMSKGECLSFKEIKSGCVGAASFSPDGLYLLTGSALSYGNVGKAPHNLSLWEVATGAEKAVLPGHTDSLVSVAFSQNGRYVLSLSRDNDLRLWEFDWEWEFPDPADWDEGARPYLDIFLTLHTPYGRHGLSRVGAPQWTEEDFQKLLKELGIRGYGWLRPEGVRRELEKMARERGWKGG